MIGQTENKTTVCEYKYLTRYATESLKPIAEKLSLLSNSSVRAPLVGEGYLATADVLDRAVDFGVYKERAASIMRHAIAEGLSVVPQLRYVETDLPPMNACACGKNPDSRFLTSYAVELLKEASKRMDAAIDDRNQENFDAAQKDATEVMQKAASEFSRITGITYNVRNNPTRDTKETTND